MPGAWAFIPFLSFETAGGSGAKFKRRGANTELTTVQILTRGGVNHDHGAVQILKRSGVNFSLRCKPQRCKF
eukprot:8379276-Pyramimonas_sp.AAC.1